MPVYIAGAGNRLKDLTEVSLYVSHANGFTTQTESIKQGAFGLPWSDKLARKKYMMSVES